MLSKLKDFDTTELNAIKTTLTDKTNTTLEKLSQPLTKESVESIIETFQEIETSSKQVMQVLNLT